MNNVAIGSVYIGIGVIILPIHLLILVILLAYKDYRHQISYGIMFSIGITDILQLIAHIYSGIMTIYLNNFNNWVEKILGGMANAAWLAMIPQTLVLAINRLIVFRSHGHPTISWKLFLFLILLSWLFGLAYFIFYLSPYCGLVYSLDAFAWSYDMSELSPLISTIEYYTSVPILIIAFIVYILVLYVLIAQRKSFTSNNKFLAGHELRLLIQSFLIFFYASFLICCWHYYQYFLPDSPYTVAVINAFWILFSGLNPFLYLTLNKEIRHRFLLLLFCRRVDTKSTLVVTISTARTRESKISTVGTPH